MDPKPPDDESDASPSSSDQTPDSSPQGPAPIERSRFGGTQQRTRRARGLGADPAHSTGD